MVDHNIRPAGVDIGKCWLDLAIESCAEPRRFSNDAEGRRALLAALSQAGATRVGLEASGGYERPVVDALRKAGYDVVLFQPRQVRAYATYRLRRAKTDKIDAALIAACAADHGTERSPPDPRLAALAEPLRLLEQIEDDIARLKTRSEAYLSTDIRAFLAEEIKRLKQLRAAQIKRLRAALAANPTSCAASSSSSASKASANAQRLPCRSPCPNWEPCRAKRPQASPGSRPSTIVPASTPAAK